jgi:hypothetical protein
MKRCSNTIQLQYIPSIIYIALTIISTAPLFLLSSLFLWAYSAELNCYKNDLKIKCELVRKTPIREHSRIDFYDPKGVTIQDYHHNKGKSLEAWIITSGSERVSFLDRRGGQEVSMTEADIRIKEFLGINNFKHLNIVFLDDDYFVNILGFLYLIVFWLIIMVASEKIVVVKIDKEAKEMFVIRKRFFVFKIIEKYPIQNIKEVLFESKRREINVLNTNREMIHYVHISLENKDIVNIFAIRDFNSGWHKAKNFSLLMQEYLKESQ